MPVDRETGSISKQVEGDYGKYSAKVFPIQIAKGVRTRIFRPVSEEAANRYSVQIATRRTVILTSKNLDFQNRG
jgi:hypothetical protein